MRLVVEKLRAGEVCNWKEEDIVSSEGSEPLTVEQWVAREVDRNVALLTEWRLTE